MVARSILNLNCHSSRPNHFPIYQILSTATQVSGPSPDTLFLGLSIQAKCLWSGQTTTKSALARRWFRGARKLGGPLPRDYLVNAEMWHSLSPELELSAALWLPPMRIPRSWKEQRIWTWLGRFKGFCMLHLQSGIGSRALGGFIILFLCLFSYNMYLRFHLWFLIVRLMSYVFSHGSCCICITNRSGRLEFMVHVMLYYCLLLWCIRRFLFLLPFTSSGEFLGPISVFDIRPYYTRIARKSLGVPEVQVSGLLSSFLSRQYILTLLR